MAQPWPKSRDFSDDNADVCPATSKTRSGRIFEEAATHNIVINRRAGIRRSQGNSESDVCQDSAEDSVVSENENLFSAHFFICKVLSKVANVYNSRRKLFLTFVALFCVAVLVFCGTCYFSKRVESLESLPERIIKIKDQIKEQFPSQDDKLWSTIFQTILQGLSRDPSRPVVLLLLDRGDDQEERTNNCLVSMVAEKASKILEVEEPDPIIIDGSEFQTNAVFQKKCDSFLSDFKERVEKQGTLVLKHLEDIPSNIAEALHYFCDTENPLVKKSVYLFTMSVTNSEWQPTSAAEKNFRELWKEKIKNDHLEPLVTRLTEQVAFIKAEKNLPFNC